MDAEARMREASFASDATEQERITIGRGDTGGTGRAASDTFAAVIFGPAATT